MQTSHCEVETIVAPATAPGAAGVAVVRVSGANTSKIAEKLFSKAKQLFPTPGLLVYGEVVDQLATPATVLDQAMAVYFKGPKSFTGEDVLELHLHGGTYLTTRAIENILALGARMARPGEFSQRAFLNGKIDLTQAEAIADLIAAETQAQACVAAQQLQGKFSQAVIELGEPLRNVLAHIEATIDFPEEDIEPLTYQAWRGKIQEASTVLQSYIASYKVGRVMREGAKVVLAGLPNAGKSSLLNAISGEDRAIVTPIPGTTRDAVDVRISLDGLAVSFWDTAGLAQSNGKRQLDEVERLGVARSWNHIEQADLVLFVVDLGQELSESMSLYREIAKKNRVLLIANKLDIVDEVPRLEANNPHFISVKTGQGVGELIALLKQELLLESGETHRLLVTTARHVEALKVANQALQRAEEALTQQLPAELIAADVRSALWALEDIIGATPTEDILGRIFSTFCIGK